MKKIFLIMMFCSISMFSESYEPEVTNSETLVLIKAEAFSNLSQNAKALKLVEALFSEESSAAVYFAAAIYAREVEENKKVEKYLIEALRRMPRFYRARLTLGQQFLETEKFADASEQFSKLVDSRYRNKALVWKLLGYSLMQDNRLQAAEMAYKSALVRKPDDAEVKRALLHTLLAGEKIAEIRPLLKEMLSENSKDRELWQLAVAVESVDGRPDKVLEKLVMAEFSGVVDTKLQIALATNLFENELYRDASIIYQRLLKSEKLSVKQSLQAAEAFMCVNDFDTVIKLLEDEKQFSQQMEKYLLLKARLAHFLTNQKQSVLFYEKLLRQFPICGDGLLEYSQLKIELGEVDKAYDLLRRASQIDQFRRRALIEMAQILVSKKSYVKAVELLDDVQRIKYGRSVDRYQNSVRKLITVK